jgi:hypothetical protein
MRILSDGQWDSGDIWNDNESSALVPDRKGILSLTAFGNIQFIEKAEDAQKNVWKFQWSSFRSWNCIDCFPSVMKLDNFAKPKYLIFFTFRKFDRSLQKPNEIMKISRRSNISQEI